MDPIVAAFKKATVDDVRRTFKIMQKDGERASMYTVREVGRVFTRGAAKTAPVYRGDRTDVVPGLLKKSFHSSKRLKGLGTGTFSLVAGPRGPRVHKYANKQNIRTGFVGDAYAKAVAAAPGIHARALDRVLARSRR